MDAIEAIEDELKKPVIAETRPDLISLLSVEATSALEEDRVRAALHAASPVLSDAANSLYASELEQARGRIETDDADDDRAAGRMEHARLDLLSE